MLSLKTILKSKTLNTMRELSEEAKQLRRNYHNEWNRKNPDKVKKYMANVWEKKARALKAPDLGTSVSLS